MHTKKSLIMQNRHSSYKDAGIKWLVCKMEIMQKYIIIIITRGCGRWGAARYGAVLAVEYVRAVSGLSTSVQGGKGSLRHLPNMKLIDQQVAKLWGIFANNAISRRDLDLWPLDLVQGSRDAGVPGSLPTKFRICRPVRFPSRWRHAGFRVRSAHPSNSWELWNWSTGCSCLRDPSCQVSYT